MIDSLILSEIAELEQLASLVERVHYKDTARPTFNSKCLHWYLEEGALVFAGSDTLADWKVNLDFWHTPSPRLGMVHRGMLKLAQRVWDDVKITVLGKMERITSVTGYSLGAGIALLIAERLKNVKVTTFAAPTVGDITWAETYPHPVVECRVTPDIITIPHLGRSHISNHFEFTIEGGWNPIKNHVNTLELFKDFRKTL